MGAAKPDCRLLFNANRSLDFAFSAFGLLLDNSVALGATRIYVSILHRPPVHNEPLIMIEDNGVFPWPMEDLLPTLQKCQVPNHVILDSWQRKIKKEVEDENSRKEFGINLKLGCLRLGSGFIWASIEEATQNRHVAVCETTEQGELKLTYFCVVSETEQVKESWMETGCEYVRKKYGTHLAEMLQRKNMNNSVLILGTEINKSGSVLRFSEAHNDLLLGEESILIELERRGYRIDQCIDISLRTYLSLLYLQLPQVEGIYLGFHSRPTKVHIQLSIEIVDQLCRDGYLVEVDNVLDFELKMSELYLLKSA